MVLNIEKWQADWADHAEHAVTETVGARIGD